MNVPNNRVRKQQKQKQAVRVYSFQGKIRNRVFPVAKSPLGGGGFVSTSAENQPQVPAHRSSLPSVFTDYPDGSWILWTYNGTWPFQRTFASCSRALRHKSVQPARFLSFDIELVTLPVMLTSICALASYLRLVCAFHSSFVPPSSSKLRLSTSKLLPWYQSYQYVYQ